MADSPESLDAVGAANLHWYVRQMQQPWKAAVSVAACLALVGASIGIGAFNFSAQLSMSFLPSPALAAVYAAFEDFQENNPVFVNGDIEAILMQRVDGSSVLDPSLPTNQSAQTVGNALIAAVNSSVYALPSGVPPPYRVRWFYTCVAWALFAFAMCASKPPLPAPQRAAAAVLSNRCPTLSRTALCGLLGWRSRSATKGPT
jgi:hypothetical protein